MPRFRAERPELMASFRSAFAAGQLTLSLPAAHSREVRYARRSELACEGQRRRGKTGVAAENRKDRAAKFCSLRPAMTIQQSIPLPTDAAPATEAAARVTPMMEQYLEIKAANPGLLLFYRMGDFYELFFEDAEIASRALGIMLTKRGKHQGMDIPMCGVPVERSDDYLHRLIEAGQPGAGGGEGEGP